jgi:ABC-type multidrug transport system permease subunit
MIAGKHYSKSNFFSKNKYLQMFYADKELISKLEQLETNIPKQFIELIEKTGQYVNSVKDSNLSDVRVERLSTTSWLKLSGSLFVTILTLPVFIFGFTFNSVPFYFPRQFLRRKVKNITFMSTFNFGVGLVIFPIIYLLEITLLLALTNSWLLAVSAFILMPFAGKQAWKLLQFYQYTFQEVAFLLANKALRTKYKKLVNQRNELIKQIFGKIKA